MKRIRLKFISVLAAIVFVCICASPAAYGVEPLSFHMEGVVADGGVLRIYCNTNLETTPQIDNFTATLDNFALPVRDITAFEDADEGVSYIFLVDISGSIRQAQFQAIKDTIAEICDGLTDKDNISIFSVGDETYTQPFVSSAEDIQAQIDAIERRQEDTNLYESIVKSLNVMNTHENCHDKKALVVFSDGEEDHVRGITLDETVAKIRESRVPIYTVAMLGTNPAARYVETAKVLGSFARYSPGGKHYIHTLDKVMSETVAADILDSIGHSIIVSADLSGFSSEGGDMLLRLELTVAGAGRASDGYYISTTGLSAPEPTSGTVSEATPEPERMPDSTADNTKSNHLARIVAGGLTFLVLGATLFFILRRKKSDSGVSVADAPAKQIPARPATVGPPPGKPRIALRLTKIGLIEAQVFRAEFAGELVIGRDPSKAALPFKDDELLSGRHCSITYESEGIVLRDLGSTNRTFVNGIPIQDKYILENDDVLLVGSMELRVNWEELGS